MGTMCVSVEQKCRNRNKNTGKIQKHYYQLGQPILHLLLSTGRAISNLARNWKYCSSVCCVKPVPSNRICTIDVISDTIGSKYHPQRVRQLRKPKSKLTLRSTAWMTPFLVTDREDFRCMIPSKHPDSHTGQRKYSVQRPRLVSGK